MIVAERRIRVRAAALAVPALAALAAAAAPPQAGAAGERVTIDHISVGTRTAPVVVRADAGPNATISLSVNGHRAAAEFQPAPGGSRVVNLCASDGIRPGKNRLLVRARGIDGQVTRAHGVVSVPEGPLLADAGGDSGVYAGADAQLGAEPGSPPGRRAYQHRWRVVDAPRNADFDLGRAAHPRPLLTAETPGTYVLRLSVRRRPGAPAFHDTVTVAVNPDDPPIGAPVNTLGPNGAIVVGGEAYGGNADVSWVVLERTTRKAVESGTVSANDAGMAKLWQEADQYGGGRNFQRYLMILSGRSGVSASQQAAFARVLRRLGSSVLAQEDFTSLTAGRQFSVIGIPGGVAGAATVRIPPGYPDPPVSAAITGYLQKNRSITMDGTNPYDFTSGEHPTFDTRAPESTTTRNVMWVAGAKAETSLPADATAGFHLLVLESTTLRGLHNRVLVTNGTGGTDRTRQAAVAAQLKSDFDEPGGPTVVLQTIGNPKGAGPEWSAIVKQLGRLGANRNLVYALDGTSEYAVVGRVGADAPPIEASTAYDLGPYGKPSYPSARLVGSLARARDSKFVPTVASTPTATNPQGGVQTDITAVAWQPETPWPVIVPLAGESERAAVMKFICQGIGYCQTGPNSCQELRRCYWERYRDNWADNRTRMNGLKWPGASAGFTEQTLTDAKEQLGPEFSMVDNVRNYFRNLRDPLVDSKLASYVSLQQVGKDVWQSLQRPTESSSAAWTLGLLSKLASLGAFAEGAAATAASGLSASFDGLAYLSTPQGAPILGDEVKVRGDQLAVELFNRVDAAGAAMTGLGLMMVSDYGKLKAADDKIKNAWALDADDTSIKAQLETSSKQWFYESLVPVAYPYLIKAAVPNARSLDCRIQGTGWPNQPDDAQMWTTVGYDEAGNPIKNIVFFARGRGGAMSPPSGLGDRIFKPTTVEDPGLGVEKLTFFTPELFGNRIVHAVSGTRACGVASLPLGT